MISQKNKDKPVLFKRGYLLFLLCTILICIISPLVTANAPSVLTISYNLEIQTLQATITHPVSDPTTHYIYKVDIKKNGVVYNTSTYMSQPDSNSFIYTYRVNATTGDTLDITASCIQGGSKTSQYAVATTNGDNKKSTPGFEMILIIGGILITVAILRRKNIQ